MPTDIEIQNAEDNFFAQNQEALAYKTDANLDTLYSYIVGAWGESTLANVACWEIAYKALNGKLKKIPGYKPPVSAEMRAKVANTPGYIAREMYAKDAEFRAAFDAIALEEKDRQDLLKWAKDYRWMSENDPNGTALRLVEEPGFRQAVDKLISEGLI